MGKSSDNVSQLASLVLYCNNKEGMNVKLRGWKGKKTIVRAKLFKAKNNNKLLLICKQVKIWFQNRRMKWRNSKEKEVLSNRCLQEEGLQENYLSRSTMNFTSPCPSVWEMSEERASPRWRENSPGNSERLTTTQPPPRANSLQSPLYLYPDQDTANKASSSVKE